MTCTRTYTQNFNFLSESHPVKPAARILVNWNNRYDSLRSLAKERSPAFFSPSASIHPTRLPSLSTKLLLHPQPNLQQHLVWKNRHYRSFLTVGSVGLLLYSLQLSPGWQFTGKKTERFSCLTRIYPKAKKPSGNLGCERLRLVPADTSGAVGVSGSGFFPRR